MAKGQRFGLPVGFIVILTVFHGALVGSAQEYKQEDLAAALEEFERIDRLRSLAEVVSSYLNETNDGRDRSVSATLLTPGYVELLREVIIQPLGMSWDQQAFLLDALDNYAPVDAVVIQLHVLNHSGWFSYWEVGETALLILDGREPIKADHFIDYERHSNSSYGLLVFTGIRYNDLKSGFRLKIDSLQFFEFWTPEQIKTAEELLAVYSQ